MKRIFILSGGTGAAWYLIRSVRRWYPNEFEVVVGDIYSEEFIPAATLADKFVRLPAINTQDYYKKMLNIFEEVKPDFIIPIIDEDLFYFPCDSSDLKELKITSTAPEYKTTLELTNKRNMHNMLNKLDIETPEIVDNFSRINPKQLYVTKPIKGHGSIGVKVQKGECFDKSYDFVNNIVQKALNNDTSELSIDVFCRNNKIYACARNRLSIKAGVCTKMSLYKEDDLPPLIDSIKKVNNMLALPMASCVQFMKDDMGIWNLIDFNLRIGGGTALSDAVGFHIGKAIFASFLNKEITDEFFEIDYSIKSVCRVYDEIVMV